MTRKKRQKLEDKFESNFIFLVMVDRGSLEIYVSLLIIRALTR